MKLRTVLFLSLATLLLAATVMTIPAQSKPVAQSTQDALTPVLHQMEMSPEQTIAYWTKEAMASAVPALAVDPATGAGAGAGPVDPALAQPQGGFGAFNGCAPGEACGDQTVTAAQAGIEPMYVTQYYPTPWPYDWAYMASAWSTFFPMRTNAKLFYSWNGGNYVGSATVLYDNGAGVNRLVATSGYTVGKSGIWDSSALVCPAYSNGVGPWGCWPVVYVYAYTNWVNSTDFRWDYGFMVTTTTSTTGYGRIASVIGSQGAAWNYSYVEEFWQYGYPDQTPFNGLYMVWNTAGTGAVANFASLGAPYELGTGSVYPAFGGEVGGGWIINQRVAAAGWLNGENSLWEGTNNYRFSSYHNTDWLNLYNAIRVYNP